MGIGARKRVQLVGVTVTQNVEGTNVNTAQAAIDTWAEVRNPSGFRQFINGMSLLGETKDFFIRYDFGVVLTKTWHIVYDGKKWVPSQVQKIDEKKFYYRITASTGDNV